MKPDLLKQNVKKLGIVWALLLLCVVASFISPNFRTSKNLINIVRNVSINGIIAVGMSFVILTGGIDLSVGASVNLVAAVTALGFIHGLHPVISCLIGLACGAVVGFLNGIGITKGKIPPFIMTLGSVTAVSGLAMYITGGAPQSWRKTPVDFEFLGRGSLLGIPFPIYVFAIVVAVSFFILRYTVFGRNVYAIGDSREAARLSGIHVDKVEILVYTISGFMAALSSLVLMSRLGVGEPTSGDGCELDAIAMVIIGGTSAAGGTGSIIGTVIGATLLSVLANLLNLVGISPFIQKIVKGLIIIAAILLEKISKKENA
ncbi:MAG: ABC transporter permease [Lachnospiraceae bacterium]|jgi:ribose transport system permease protein|nr:ABC transporter permease [Lachnospiraceae bacterium]